ncbi:hypothetical protein AKJ16_DCAP17873 [Drosera capensis]
MMEKEGVEWGRRHSHLIQGDGFLERGLQADAYDGNGNGNGRVRYGEGCLGVGGRGDQVMIREAGMGYSVLVGDGGMMSKVSRFDEGLGEGESAAMKFQWKNLLAASASSKAGGLVVSGNFDGVGKGSEGRGYFPEYGGSGKEVQGSRFRTGDAPVGMAASYEHLMVDSERERATLLRYSSSMGYRDTSGGSSSLNDYRKVRFEEDEALHYKGISHPIKRETLCPLRELGDSRICSSVGGSCGPTALDQSNYVSTQTHVVSKEYMQGSYQVGHRPPYHVSYCRSHEAVSTLSSSLDEYSPIIRYASVEAPTFDKEDNPRVQYSSTKPYGYPSESIKGGYTDSFSVEVREKRDSARDRYRGEDLFRDRLIPNERALDAGEISYWYSQRENGLQNHDNSLKEQLILDREYRVSHDSNYTEEVVGHRSTWAEYETEGTDKSYLTEEYEYETVPYSPSYERRQYRPPKSELDPSFYMTHEKDRSSPRISQREHIAGKRRTRSHLSDLLYEAYTSDIDHDLSYNHKPIQAPSLSSHGMERQSVASYGSSGYGSSSRPSNLSISLQNRLGERLSSGSSQIKKRLKHASRYESTEGTIDNYDQQLASRAFTSPGTQLCNTKKSSIRKPLNPSVIPSQHAPQEEDVSYYHSYTNRKQRDCPAKNWEEHQLEVHPQEGDTSTVSMKPMKDPPENTEEFKRQVQDSFLKYLRFLNENPVRLRKFKEQGKAGGLKCIVCPSSKDFLDTKAIATHAFSSSKVGLRCKHLGFHKALCVLMGWESSVSSNGRWSCNTLADADACAVNKDLIIWPPVVIIHHSPFGKSHLGGSNPSPDLLETVLRGMGFNEGKNKVCRGKPGTPNIMAVKFTGTKSGLQDAERLHNIFAENNRGRTDFQKIYTTGCHHKEEEGKATTEDETEENFFGYFGIAGDLDKLHRDVKALCVIRSKKEMMAKIQALEEATLG